MCRTQCVLALAALCVGLAHSWDIAVSLGHQLIFYTDGIKTNTVNFVSHNLTALAYDEVHNRILYVDKRSHSDGICGYNLHSMENKCFIRRVGSNIHSIAFDPATETVFFTDTNKKSINSLLLKPGSNNNVNLLFTMDDRTPSDIAVDSCSGYIYWSNTFTEIEICQYIERARFNGADRKCIYDSLPVMGMVMDPQTRKIYNFDGRHYRFLDSRNLDGQNEYIIMRNTAENSNNFFSAAQYLDNPKVLTISNDYLYWMNSNGSNNTVWQLPKNAVDGEELKEISNFYNKSPLGIAANYKIKDQIKGLQDCEVLSSLIPKNTVINNFCVHGIEVDETSVCKCTPGYIGERCDVSVCENYCLQGDCSFNDEGLPKCRCNAGYSGERCEMYACYGYCLNNGDCSLNEEDEPVCQCVGNHEGTRCKVTKDEKKYNLADLLSKCLNYCLQGICSFTDDGPLCRCNPGYSGERCEVYACHSYCLNNGFCSLNEEYEPVCQCVGNHKGIRCEAVKDVTINNTPTYSAKGNLTLADLLSRWRKPTSKMFVTVEV